MADLDAIRSRCGRWDDEHPVSRMRGGEEWADQLRHDCGELLSEIQRLRDGIRQHREHVTQGLHAIYSDRSLWALLDEGNQGV